MKGFTLIEMIVVVAVLIIMGAILSQIFSNTLRGSNKAQVLSSIKQNGQSALDTMDKTIRQADKVVCVSLTGNEIVTFQSGTYTKFAFVAPTLLINGYIYQDNSNQPLDCSTFSANQQILTDTNLITGVSINTLGGVFNVNNQAGFGDIVTIKFNVSPGLGIASSFNNQIDPITFQTTVSLRGYTEIR